MKTTSEMLPAKRDTERASELMERFARRTGFTSERTERRYLWTDTFAACNFIGLAHVLIQQGHAA